MDDAVTLVEQRYELLHALAETPRSKPELVELTSYARSTVDRAIRELEDAELVERDGADYCATPAAERMVAAYAEFREAAELYYEARDAVAGVSCENPLPPAVLDGADVLEPSPASPDAATIELFDRLEGADDLRTACSCLLDVYDRYVHELVVDHGVEIDAVFTPSVIEVIESDYAERWQIIVDTGLVRAYEHASLPDYELSVARGVDHARDGVEIYLTVYTDEGEYVIANDAPDAVEWASQTLAELVDEAEQVYPQDD